MHFLETGLLISETKKIKHEKAQGPEDKTLSLINKHNQNEDSHTKSRTSEKAQSRTTACALQLSKIAHCQCDLRNPQLKN